MDDDQNNEADEAVIARAFRRSLAVFAALALVALAVGLWIAREPAPPKERSGVAERPMVAPDTSGAGVPDLRFTDVTASAGIAFTHVSGA